MLSTQPVVVVLSMVALLYCHQQWLTKGGIERLQGWVGDIIVICSVACASSWPTLLG